MIFKESITRKSDQLYNKTMIS